ncbi:MAG: tRNA (N6-isopentenyl adenosine(37)-C2)-methylthiotransferase MiaB [Planctomycetes bacterium]|nr:tRNA (N6-isopentenyl adenosine(37)-C2)-methylthiotransferase MiaB [Planctomycetota bacterium]
MSARAIVAAVPITGKSVYIETFGCQMNSADTEVVLARLGDAGYRRVDSVAEATLVLYNTCAVRDHAEAKVRGRLDAMKPVKAKRPDLRIGVMGCMAQREKDEIIRRYPHVDLVVGTDQFVRMPQLLESLETRDHVVETAFGDFEDRLWDARRTEGINAWVPIMRGCNYNCTYCVVPFTRGREKSRDPAQLEDEVRRLVDEGFVQITLLGQTVDAYGKTLGDGTTLASLLRRLHRIDGLKRLRFVTSHPKDITDELIDTVAELPKVAKHLHVPAQSGSDRILRMMGRRYTRSEYLHFVERARTRMPEVELLSDFIVGFPRETADDFAATVSLMDEVRFAGSYVFMYSPRPGTPAVNLVDDVAHETKRARCNHLLDLQLVHQGQAYAKLHGATRRVLVEGASKSDDAMLHGRSEGNLNIVFPRMDVTGASRDHLIGDLVDIRIERSTSLTLFGDLAAPVMA